jgi:hypothetical protein
MENHIQGFARKQEGKRALGIPRSRWDHKEIGWSAMNWFDLAEDRKKWKIVVDKLMNFFFP